MPVAQPSSTPVPTPTQPATTPLPTPTQRVVETPPPTPTQPFDPLDTPFGELTVTESAVTAVQDPEQPRWDAVQRNALSLIQSGKSVYLAGISGISEMWCCVLVCYRDGAKATVAKLPRGRIPPEGGGGGHPGAFRLPHQLVHRKKKIMTGAHRSASHRKY